MTWINALATIPAAVWGVLLGSLITFIGVGRQLGHDSRERDRERQMQLKRGVYLDAAEGIAGSTDQFLRFANLDVPLGQAALPTTKPGWLNKVYVVGNIETIDAFNDAGVELGVITFELLKTRISAEDAKRQVDTINTRIESIRLFQQQLQAEVHASGAQQPSQQLLERMALTKQYWDRTWSDLEVATAELSEASKKLFEMQRKLLEESVNHYRGYQSKLQRAIVELRKELELPLNESQFNRIFTESDSKMLPKFKAFLATFDEDASTGSSR
jgi:hypothetical protein